METRKKAKEVVLKENKYLASALLFVLFTFIFLMVIYLGMTSILEQWIGIYIGEMKIYPSVRLTGNHSPEYPNIGDLVYFQAKIDSDIHGKSFLCGNCTIDIELPIDKTDMIIRKNIPLNESGAVEFFYEAKPTWITVNFAYDSNLVELRYRIPKPDFKEGLIILWEESWIGRFAIILSTIAGLGFIISIVVFLYKKIVNSDKNEEKKFSNY